MQSDVVGEVDELIDVVDDVLTGLTYCHASNVGVGREHVRVAHGRLPRLVSLLRLEMLVRHRSCVEH